MSRYDKIWSALARRAVREGVTDAEAFIERGVASGLSREQIEDRLLRDLAEDGPIFGKFTRSLSKASSSAVLAAENQGEAAARAYAEKLISLSEMDDILQDADAEELDALERQLEPRELMIWIATLVNTCHRCLPLHGKTDTREGWAENGLSPDTIHDGWEHSDCECNLVPVDEVENVGEQVNPLVRTKLKSATGLPASRRTQRSVAQRDIDKARAAIEKAMESEQGRRTLRLMGQVKQGDGDG